ncbi:A-kinase anchor protein 6 isoform 3-T4 [Clarias gariepinus]
MSIVASPVISEAASPMITSVTPTLESSPKQCPCGPNESGDNVSTDRRQKYQKPPPLHTGADWKVVLHLPEIETWLRTTAERVRDLTQSVQQDSLNRHVDAHLVQLKDICEDISDHVEQIHALLETEFSLKLLSYSVNIIVDIRTVQLLWHQLRVSVLVLKERLLQGLQDSNGNYTRQTDILQAFSQDHDQARLDSLTEVDDSGQLIIKCSQDYFSLDCGITAYELSDYSPSEDPEDRDSGQEPRSLYPELERDFPELLQSVDILTIAASRQNQESSATEEESAKTTQDSEGELIRSSQGPVEEPVDLTQETQSKPMDQTPYIDTAMQEEYEVGFSKRPLQGSQSNAVSPTQPSTPKKPMYVEATRLQYQSDLSRSTPSLVDLPDRSKFWLDLNTVYPSSGSQSEENLCNMNAKNRHASHQTAFQKRRVQISLQRRSSAAEQENNTEHSNLYSRLKNKHSKTMQVSSDSSTPPPSSGEETSNHDPQESSSSLDDHLPATGSVWIMPKQPSHMIDKNSSPKEDCWYGSEEFLALPAQLKKTEMLASKLESLAQALPPRSLQQSVQDVDNWELTEANTEWETNTHLFSPKPNGKQFSTGRFSSSSSDVAASVDESIESGPLSDLVSEDEGVWYAPKSGKAERITLEPDTSRMVLQCTPLIKKLLEDIQHQENYQDIWGKLEGNRVEMAMWLPKKTQLLGWAESLKRSSIELPDDFEERMTALRVKWDQLEKSLGEPVEVRTSDPGTRGVLSPGTSSMVAQLELKIKELKSWLRDTELFIFNLSFREDAQHHGHADATCDAHQSPLPDQQLDPEQNQNQDPQAEPQAVKQLDRFKVLCVEVRGRRKGLASVLRLCQRLLDVPEEQSSEADRQSLRLLQVNLERRWEAIVMQVLQWQSHLKRTLGRDQVPGNLIEPSLIDLRGSSEDSWEWDEMDMTIVNMESHESDEQSDSEKHQEVPLGTVCHTQSRMSSNAPQSTSPPSCVYQVFSLHSVELYQQPQLSISSNIAKEKQPLLKSLSKDSSFSSVESLPDIIAGLVSGKQGLLTDSARRSESESGIVSEGDTEPTANSEICLLYQSDDPKVQVTLNPLIHSDSPCIDRVLDEDKDKILERANKCAELGDSMAKETNDQQYFTGKKKGDESRESRKKHKNEPVEILINGCCLSPESEDEGHETGAFSAGYDDDEGKVRRVSTHLSQGSSLDSLYAVGEFFPACKETLTRSMSLESWLAPCKSSGEAGSQSSLGDLSLATETTGELSRRTLELLKRLENIQTPLAQKITRSISDITLPGSSLHLLGRGPRSGGAPSSINESLAASLTELSSIEDSSAASEDLAVQKKRCLAANSNTSFRKHSRSQQLTDETDASVSMVVNVSCTSACTDDEDDSDLLSSSTLTLTEEELGIKDDEDSSITSEEEYIERSFVLGLDYMKGEFQSWVKPRAQNREKNEADLGDELQCGTLSRDSLSPASTVSDRNFLNRAALKLLESNSNTKNDSLKKQEVDSHRTDATRNYISSFVDDMENGNVDSSHLKGKDEDELLREEGSLFTKKGESFKDCYTMDDLKGDVISMVAAISPSSCRQINLQSQESTLEGQLKGELPCHNSHHSPPSLSPVEECSISHHSMLGAAHMSSQEQSASFPNHIHENHRESSSDCCSHQTFPSKEEKSEDVHSFVMEIIDMASVALKTKDVQAEQSQESSSPASTSQIKEKVLEHSHRPIHLRKGDFYSYLSLSSHDSDCGEVSTCTEEKSSTPVLSRTPEIHDEEPLFPACTEEVYLGPPLCYSMSISKRPMRRSTKLIDSFCPLSQAPPPPSNEYQKAHGISPGSIAGTQPQCHNEAPYLNPLPCETVIDTVECFADTKMLESNISPVMTKIRVSCSSTNPLKEESGLYINPKINCPPISKSDRDERGDASQWMKQKNVRKGRSSPQEAKSAHKQSARSEHGAGPVETDRRVLLSARRSDSASAVRSGVSSRPQAKRLSGNRAIPACRP